MRDFQTRRDKLTSFDGGVHEAVDLARPDKLRFWTRSDWLALPPAISRGAGLSYAPASFGTGTVSIEHRAFDRLIAFDAAKAELMVEAGADLWTCQRFLLGRGFVLPCHPGHGRITIGGCVAAAVHGKNPGRDGTFCGQVRGLTLLHPDHGLLTLDRDRDAALIDLTCGGFGLTGHILTVTLRVAPISSSHVMLMRRAHRSAAEAFADLDQAGRLADYAYSWHDLSRKGGMHFVFTATAGDADSEGQDGPLSPAVLANKAPPIAGGGDRALPIGLYNRLSLPLANAAYRWKTRRFRKPQPVPLLDALFPIHGSEAYFSLYGRPGFHEYQALVPVAAAAPLVAAVRQRAARRGVTLALCSGKAFGGASRFLRFAGGGMAVAFNFPRVDGSAALMDDIDALLLDAGGKPNIIKDSRLSARMIRACYPELEPFRSELERFDPHRRIRSSLSQRLEL